MATEIMESTNNGNSEVPRPESQQSECQKKPSTNNSNHSNKHYEKLEKVTTDLLGTIKRLQSEIQDYQCRKELANPQNKPYFKFNISPVPCIKSANNSRPASNKTSSIRSAASRPPSSRISAISKKTTPSTVSIRSSSISGTPSILEHPLKLFKDEVATAIRKKKTFTIRGTWPIVRRALTDRGWVERLHPSFANQLSPKYRSLLTKDSMELLPLINSDEYGPLARRIIKSNLLRNHQIDFYWSCSLWPSEVFKEVSDQYKIPMVSKFRRHIFSCITKKGLCAASKIAHWYQKDGVCKLSHPRTYNLANEAEYFWQDYNLTQAMSLMKYIVETYETKATRLVSPHGKIPYEAFEFACNECGKLINQKLHKHTDNQFNLAPQEEWNHFGDYFFKMIYLSNHFRQDQPDQTDERIVSKARIILETLGRVWPYLNMDGYHNIWILKPPIGCRGRGIHICRTRQYILNILKNRAYIAQKYIERPLLIYNTKFDMRQWFLITDTNPLTIWMWKECYVRFSSQTYTLRKLHESIHLTNNCVQSKYFRNNPLQDAALPNYSMWDSKQLQSYLANIGHPDAYEKIIYPGMKQNIIAATLINRDTMDTRKNCFELLGADFMLTTDFRPWLIEINSNPSMQHTTPITSRLVPRCLEDIIKVVVDNRNDPNASTGSFELIYKDKDTNVPNKEQNLQVKDEPVKRNYFCDEVVPVGGGDWKSTGGKSNYNGMAKQAIAKKFSREIKEVLQSLLTLVKQFQQ